MKLFLIVFVILRIILGIFCPDAGNDYARDGAGSRWHRRQMLEMTYDSRVAIDEPRIKSKIIIKRPLIVFLICSGRRR